MAAVGACVNGGSSEGSAPSLGGPARGCSDQGYPGAVTVFWMNLLLRLVVVEARTGGGGRSAACAFVFCWRAVVEDDHTVGTHWRTTSVRVMRVVQYVVDSFLSRPSTSGRRRLEGQAAVVHLLTPTLVHLAEFWQGNGGSGGGMSA